MPPPWLFAVTVAVKVTGCPHIDGWSEEVRSVVVPGSVVVVVVDVDVVVEVVVGGVVVVVDEVVELVGVGEVVVVELGLVVVVEAPAGLKVTSTMYQLVGQPKVMLPSCEPSALDRMSSRVEAALPFCASRRYGTIWLVPGVAQPGRPPVRTAATTSSPAVTGAVGPTRAEFPVPCDTPAWSSGPTVAP